jgi:hypothetical protein
MACEVAQADRAKQSKDLTSCAPVANEPVSVCGDRLPVRHDHGKLTPLGVPSEAIGFTTAAVIEGPCGWDSPLAEGSAVVHMRSGKSIP